MQTVKGVPIPSIGGDGDAATPLVSKTQLPPQAPEAMFAPAPRARRSFFGSVSIRRQILAALIAAPAALAASGIVAAAPPCVVFPPPADLSCPPSYQSLPRATPIVPAERQGAFGDMLQTAPPVQPLTDPSTDQSAAGEPTLSAPLQDALNDTNSVPEPITQSQVDAADFDLSSGLASTAAAGAGSLALANTPNMMGDFLGSGRNTSFNFNLAGDGNPTVIAGGSTLRNSKISDNNSAIPRDRVFFRYNRFDDGAQLRGAEPTGNTLEIQAPALVPNGMGGLVTQNFFATQNEVQSVTRDFDAHVFEAGFERRLTEDISFEMRIPMIATLDSNLELNSLSIGDGPPGNPDLFGFSTPGGTLGAYDFEFRDISFITKAALYRQRNMIVSGGLGVRVPTGRDSSVSVLDGISQLDPFGNPILTPTTTFAPDGTPIRFSNEPVLTQFRIRDIETDLQTVSITPFLATAGTLGRRFFYNAFSTLEVPIGQDQVRYTENFLDASEDSQGNFILNPSGTFSPTDGSGRSFGTFTGLTEERQIREQTLLSFDVSIGTWLHQARSPYSRVQRVAWVNELHYTTTLNDADLATFQQLDANGFQVQAFNNQTRRFAPEGDVVVGNTDNRLDVLNFTTGLQTQFRRNMTLGTAIATPLRDDGDKLFDWELQVQLNYYPGGFGRGLPTLF